MPKKIKPIYLDHAATTPVDPQVLKAMMPFFRDDYGNPSALYQKGVKAQKAITAARKTIADLLHTQPDTLIFTSGGTESDNLAIFGIAGATPPFQGGAGGGLPYCESQVETETTATPPNLPLERGGSGHHSGHIISLAIEHDAVLKSLDHLKTEGWVITLLPVDAHGLVQAKAVLEAITPQTALVTIMMANNEIGSIEPIAEIGRGILRYRKEHNTPYPYFHTDACQAAGYLDLDVEKLHVDLMTLNGSKIYGPKGIGLLYVRRGVKFAPQILGGSQEKGRRAGTENVPSIIGLAKALELVNKTKTKESKRIQKLSEYFFKKLQNSPLEGGRGMLAVKLNGPSIPPSKGARGDVGSSNRLPNNLNVVIPGIAGETLLLYLDSYGISCSTASACNMESADPSHVLKAIGLPNDKANSSLRFTLGKNTTKTEIDYTVSSLQKILKLLKK